jgi:hypothetical protein
VKNPPAMPIKGDAFLWEGKRRARARAYRTQEMFSYSRDFLENLGENVSSIAYSEQIVDVLDHLGDYLTQKRSSRLEFNSFRPKETGRKTHFSSRMFSLAVTHHHHVLFEISVNKHLFVYIYICK